MSVSKKEIMIPVPHTGVRKDVDPLVQDGTMAEIAENAIRYDAVIRPRPALTANDWAKDNTPSWKQVLSYTSTDFTGWDATAIVACDNGYLFASMQNDANTAQKFMYSSDGGDSWQDSGITHPLAASSTLRIVWMKIVAGYLFMYGKTLTAIADPETHTPIEYIYRADMSTFPTSLTFTSIGPVELDANDTDEVAPATDPYYFSVFEHPLIVETEYDSDSGWLLFFSREDTTDATSAVFALKNCLTTSSASDFVHICGDWLTQTVGDTSWYQARWINKEWLVYPQITFSSVMGRTGYITELVFRKLMWDGVSAYEFDANDELTTETIGSMIADADGIVQETYESYSSKDNVVITPTHACIHTQTRRMILPVKISVSGTGDVTTHTEIIEFKLGRPDTTDPVIMSYQTISEIGNPLERFMIGNGGNYSGRLVLLMATTEDGNVYDTVVYTSDDLGYSWKRSAPFDTGFDISENVWTSARNLVYNESTLDHFWVWPLSGAANIDTSINAVWYSPSSGGPGVAGELTSMFQMDTDYDDDVLFVGTTKTIFKLDVDTSTWESICANHDETVPGGTGETDWVDSGDVPPLRVADDRDEYVNKVSIDATYGDHPWVFRSFETQGNIFLIGTNGQAYPIAYHPDMAGSPDGFARRLGEVPPGDPNAIASWDADFYPSGWSETGNLAPRARCLASAYSRLLLGNLPDVSPYGVDVSGFEDPDRGWGIEQRAVLGDTAGSIVSMNEISALQVAIYKEDAIYHAVAQTELLGVAAPFRFELSKIGVPGPCSPGSVLNNYDGRHIFLARDGGVYLYDGVAPLDLGRNVRRMIQDDLDLNNLGKCWGMSDRRRKLVWFFYPSNDGLVNRGVVIQMDAGHPFPCWPVRLPAGWNFAAGGEAIFTKDAALGSLGPIGGYGEKTLGSFSAGDQQMLMGTQNMLWYNQKWEDDGDFSDDGEPIKLKLRGGLVTPGGVRLHRAEELYHIFSSADPAQEIKVKLLAQQVGQNMLETEARTLTAGKKRRRTRHRVRGTQFKVDLEGDITRLASWGGAVLKYNPGGGR